jgi:hypothetical protein
VVQEPFLLEDHATPSRNTLPMVQSTRFLSRIYLLFQSSQDDEYNALCQEELQPNPIITMQSNVIEAIHVNPAVALVNCTNHQKENKFYLNH